MAENDEHGALSPRQLSLLQQFRPDLLRPSPWELMVAWVKGVVGW